MVFHCARPTRAPLLSFFQSRMERMRVEGQEFLSWFSHTSGEERFEATLPKERRS
jgi:hypothetical protein